MATTVYVDFVRRYLKVEVMSGTALASLKEDGTGADCWRRCW